MSVDIKKVAEDLFNVVASNDELREGFLKDPMGTIKNNVKEAISEEDAKEIAEEINISQAEVSKRLFELSQIVKTHF